MLQDFERPEDELLKTERKAEIIRLTGKLVQSQQEIREEKLPVIVLVEGWDASGKRSLINELISEMDPRFFKVYSPAGLKEEEECYPFLHEYFQVIPADGKFLFLDSGWMEETVTKHIRRGISNKEYERRLESVNVFERQLRDNGYVVVKLFLHISEEEQLRRLSVLRSDRDTEWRVTDRDLWQNREYKRFLKEFDSFMEDTSEYAPWHILDGEKKNKRLYDALTFITRAVDEDLADGRNEGQPVDKKFPLLGSPSLEDADHEAAISREEYKKELERLQKKLDRLQNVLYRKKIPVVICYEGWDAAGKGGNIRRVSYPLDPCGFDVIPISSPTPDELAHHYLWRFWTKLPKAGHITIFDRTWYGRVMVERIEGYCSEADWKRAYGEINEFEKELTDYGTVLFKFWINISSETQLQRFNDRQNTPEKQWKITEEDWRNRDKWADYEVAVEEMFRKTSTEYAPWHLIDSDCKEYARIQTLRIITDKLEEVVNENIVRGIKSECAAKKTENIPTI